MLDETRLSRELASAQTQLEHLRREILEKPPTHHAALVQSLNKLTRDVDELRAFQQELRAQSDCGGASRHELESRPGLESGAPSEAESRFRALFMSAADAILLVSHAGVIIEANPSASQLLACGPDALVELKLDQLLGAAVPDALDGSNSWRGETEVRRLDGRIVPVEACAMPLEQSDPPLILWTLRNIAERRRLAKLQEEFLSMAAHELKTPLTSLKGFAQLLQRGIGGQRAAEVVVQQADHLNMLVSDLLDVARLESGRIVIQPREIDLQVVLNRAIERTRVLARSHSIEMEPIDHPIVGRWDPQRLEQVVANLLSNALKHAPDSRHIMLRVREDRESVHTTVRDFGPGIAPAAMSNLFNRFYRVDNPTSRGVEGMGLGLYLSRVIIEAHGGSIQALSKLGEGCAFTFTLPLASSPNASGAA
jgi:PAS domain S-box-containing protein